MTTSRLDTWEMRNDACESDLRNLHEQLSERNDEAFAIEVSPDERGTGIPAPARTAILPIESTELESFVSAPPSPLEPLATICASTAFVSSRKHPFPDGTK
ncbi:hypothetical protein ACHAW6_011938 [Cyclotella cf. meneghiniana]